MPELPEVETIVRGLRGKLVGKVISDLWTDWPKYFRNPNGLRTSIQHNGKEFRRHVLGKKILGVERRAKNIIFKLSDKHIMLVHQKMSGHLLFGKWRRNNKESKVKDKKQAGVWEKEKWLPDPFSGPLTDPMNRFIRLVFIFKGGEMMALSDLRRFAKVMSGKEEDVLNSRDIAELGPEPLEKDFSFLKFRKLFQGKRGAIKQTLLDQGFISGIGNIYADEILWDTKIHPLFRVEKLSEKQVRDLYRSIRRILSKAIRFRGASIGDYRDSFGREGEYNKHSFAYHRDGLPCRRCGTIIVRMKIGARSAHFCPKCQGDV